MILLELALIGFLVATASLVALSRGPIAATAVFAAFSLGIAIVWVWLSAPDVALTEAAVGAGVMVLLLLVAAVRTNGGVDVQAPRGSSFRPINGPALLLATAVAVPMAMTVVSLPDVGTPDAPAVSETDPTGAGSPYAAYVGEPAVDLAIPNAVATVLTVFRSLDTLGEVVVAFTAVIGVLIVLGRTHLTAERSPSPQSDRSDHPNPFAMSPVGMTAVRLVVPLVFVFGVSLTVQGLVEPGGGFQGGIVMGAALILVALLFGHRPTAEWIDERALVWLLVAGVWSVLGVVAGTALLAELNADLLVRSIPPIYLAEFVEIGIGVAVGAIVTGLVFALALGLDGRFQGGDRR